MFENHNIASIMSRPGYSYDNSPAESFFVTIKKELIYRKSYGSIEDVEYDIFEYIELFTIENGFALCWFI